MRSCRSRSAGPTRTCTSSAPTTPPTRSPSTGGTTRRASSTNGACPCRHCRRTSSTPTTSATRLRLDLLADGVKLTPGGRLPRAVVRVVQEHRPGWYPLERPASIEDDLYPLATLHDILRHVRLLRLANGVLRPTKAAGNENGNRAPASVLVRPAGVLDHDRRARGRPARSSRPDAGPAARHRGVRLVGRRLAACRPTDHRPRRRARAPPPVRSTPSTRPHHTTNRSSWSPGPSAHSLLPGATLLADLL